MLTNTATSSPLPPISQWIKAIEASLGVAPRPASWFLRSRFKTPRPPWCVVNDPLLMVQTEKRRLLAHGQVKLAYVLRWDSILESRGPVHGSADVLYVTDDKLDVSPSTLATIGQNLLALNHQADLGDQERRFASFLAVANQRGFGVRTPDSLAEGIPTAVSSMIAYRHFLPGAILSRRLIPLLVAAEAPRVAITIPKSYWPDSMYDWWLAEA